MKKDQTPMSPPPARPSSAHQSDGLLLLDYLWRLGPSARRRAAVHLALSRLRPDLRRPHHLRVAHGLLRQEFRPDRAHLFVLASGDVFITMPMEDGAAAKEVIAQIQDMFQEGGSAGRPCGAAGLATWFDMEADLEAVLGLAARDALLHAVEPAEPPVSPARLPRARREEEEAPSLLPLTSDKLDDLLRAVDRIDLSPLFRRQFACAITDRIVSPPRLVEHYVGVADLGETLMPGVAIAANPWLFQRFKVALDEKILRSNGWWSRFYDGITNSINITTETTEKDFFREVLSRTHALTRAGILFEFDQADVLANVPGFVRACTLLRRYAHHVCLDGLTEATLRVVDLAELHVDFVKVTWHPAWHDSVADSRRRLQDLVHSLGDTRVVLTRVDCDDAVGFGQRMGIRLFQGRLVDARLESRARRQRFSHRSSADPGRF